MALQNPVHLKTRSGIFWLCSKCATRIVEVWVCVCVWFFEQLVKVKLHDIKCLWDSDWVAIWGYILYKIFCHGLWDGYPWSKFNIELCNQVFCYVYSICRFIFRIGNPVERLESCSIRMNRWLVAHYSPFQNGKSVLKMRFMKIP